MEDNRFFKFVWRFNAIVFMAAGIIALGVLMIAGYHIIYDITREQIAGTTVNVVEGQPADEKWELGKLYKVDGTPFAMVPLTSDQSYAKAYYSKSSHSVRNYLFVDTKKNENKWLFNTNAYLVADIDFLSEKAYNDKERTVRAILYTVIEKDTNGDQRLTDEDDTTIAVTLPGGQSYKKILTGIDVFIGHQVLDNENVLLIYQKKGMGFSANLFLRDFSIQNERKLPKIKHTP